MKNLFTSLLGRSLLFAIGFAVVITFLARGPNFPIDWNRAVPSKEPISTIERALGDTRNWPVFYHALKSVALFENEKPVEGFDRITPGMTALFVIEPPTKEWKRFEIKAEVLAPNPGESLRFRLLSESSGKTTRLIDSFEWWVGVQAPNESEAKRGYVSEITGGAVATTKTARARFLGRFAPKILMNQLYQIDLVRLANFTANMEAWAKKDEPVYR